MKDKGPYFTRVARDSTSRLINLWPSVRTSYPPLLCQCSVSRVFKATATRNRGKSKQTSIECRGSNWRPSAHQPTEPRLLRVR